MNLCCCLNHHSAAAQTASDASIGLLAPLSPEQPSIDDVCVSKKSSVILHMMRFTTEIHRFTPAVAAAMLCHLEPANHAVVDAPSKGQ